MWIYAILLVVPERFIRVRITQEQAEWIKAQIAEGYEICVSIDGTIIVRPKDA